MDHSAFEKEIRSQFRDIIETNGFEVHYSDNAFKILELVNEKCIVRFIDDWGLIVCDFADPVEKRYRESLPGKGVGPAGYPIYPASMVWRFLYSNDKKDYNYGYEETGKQVRAIKSLLVERLARVLEGDFSWAKDLRQTDEKSL
jgi:hypothetical protein